MLNLLFLLGGALLQLTFPCLASSSFEINGVDEALMFRALNFSSTVYCPKQILIPTYNCSMCEAEPEFVIESYLEGPLNTVGYVGYNRGTKEIWISWRGTQATSLSNWISDLELNMVTLDFKHPGLR
eukprot:Awhi_evm1s14218